VPQQRLELVEPRRLRVVGLEAGGEAELLGHGPQRGAGVVGRALVAQGDLVLALGRVQHRPDQPGLADAGLADQEHRLTLAGRGLPPALEHEPQLLLAPDHGGHPVRPAGLEAALGPALAGDLEARHEVLEALEPERAEAAQLEHVAQEPARAVRDHHRPRRRRLLQPRREVRGLADHRLLAGRPLAGEVPDHHEAGRHAHPRRERPAGGRRQPGHGLDDAQPGPHGPLGRVLVRPGPAEVGEHPVAHELGDVALEARHRARHGVLVRAEDVSHLLRVEPAREGGGAGQVGEHDGELPSLGLPGRRCGIAHRPGCGRVPGVQGGDRVGQLAPVADGDDPDLPQVLRREARQDVGVDAVVGERPRVLPQAQSLEPGRDVHAPLPGRPTRNVPRSGTYPEPSRSAPCNVTG
jgi:hypothetical protein